jgi:MFS family permease
MAAAAFVTVYLSATRHWNPAQVGIVVGAQNIATMLGQPFAGALIDRSERKKWLVMAAATIVAIGCLLVLIARTAVEETATQILIALASAIFAPAIAAISLGLVGHEYLASRVARNEAFNHAGKVALAVIAACVGIRFGHSWIFGLLSAFGIGAVVAASRIREREIDHEAARAADQVDGTGKQDRHGYHLASIHELIRDRRIPTFLACIVLFHLANAALLQLIGQRLALGNDGLASTYMSACIIVAQITMIPVALIAGKFTGRVGRRPIFLTAYCVVGLRALLFATADSPTALIAIQMLDGIGSALFGVTWTLINSDLAKGTGRFNLLQGSAAAAWYCGAFASNFIGGVAANRWGFSRAFLGLAITAACGFLLFLLRMPETGLGLEQEPRMIAASKSLEAEL